MADATSVLKVQRCAGCQSTFLPRSGPCPRCGAADVSAGEVAAHGVVLAATELWAPPEGRPAPHRLVLVECDEQVRVLAWTDGDLPSAGSEVEVVDDGEGAYRLDVKSAAHE